MRYINLYISKLYMCGYFILMDIQIKSSVYNALQNEDAKHVWNWMIAIGFMEFYLGVVIAILYGVNCWKKIFEQRRNRILSLLIQILIVSLILFIGYTYMAVQLDEEEIWTLPVIAAGYGLMCVCCITYLLFQDKMRCREKYGNITNIGIKVYIIFPVKRD